MLTNRKYILLCATVVVTVMFIWFSRIYWPIRGFIVGIYEIKKYEKVCKENFNNKPLKLNNVILIAHAGGGLHQKNYLNTLDAINNSLAKGFIFFEMDINQTKDDSLVMSHDYVNLPCSTFLKDNTTGTHLTLTQLMHWLSDKSVFLITDIKIKNKNIYILNNLINSYPFAKEQIIPQAYTLDEIISCFNLGFKRVIFTNYNARYPAFILKRLAETNTLFAITIPYKRYEYTTLEKESFFTKSPTPFFTHAVIDTLTEKAILSKGIKGVYTDFMSPFGNR